MPKHLIRFSDDLPSDHWIAQQLPSGTSLRTFAEDEAISNLTSAVQAALDRSGVTRAEVADLLGTTRSYVSQVLNGSTNMTLRTLGALLWAAGQQVGGLRLEALGTTGQSNANGDAMVWSNQTVGVHGIAIYGGVHVKSPYGVTAGTTVIAGGSATGNFGVAGPIGVQPLSAYSVQ